MKWLSVRKSKLFRASGKQIDFCGPQVKEPNVLGRPLRARAKLHEVGFRLDIEIVARSRKQFDVCGRQVRKPKAVGRPLRGQARLHEVVFGWTSKIVTPNRKRFDVCGR